MLKELYYGLKERLFRYGKKWDEYAPEEDEAVKFAHEHINAEPIINSYTDTEYLLASSSMSINDSLRGNSKEFVYLADEIKKKYIIKTSYKMSIEAMHVVNEDLSCAFFFQGFYFNIF